MSTLDRPRGVRIDVVSSEQAGAVRAIRADDSAVARAAQQDDVVGVT